MSIDMSSVIPFVHPSDIKIKTKDEDAKRSRPIEEAYEADSTGLQMDKEEIRGKITRDNQAGVGDTYSTRGALVKESRARQGSSNLTAAEIDMVI
jgi:hypothetical protein